MRPTILFPDDVLPYDEQQQEKRIDIKLSDIITFNNLGKGASGCVKKAVHKPTKKLLALKQINLKNDD